MNRQPLVVGNWKMHCAEGAARAWCRALRAGLEEGSAGASELAVAPPYTSIAAVAEAVKDLPIALAAQNCDWEETGPRTGEISAQMLREAGCTFAIVGHSERRQIFGETDRAIAQKVRAVCAAGMTPILCIGESENQRASGRMEPLIESQLRNGLSEIDDGRAGGFVLAYEPVWAIGTGKVASDDQAQEAHRFLRHVLSATAGPETGGAARILYGGSVNPGNAVSLAARPDVDGFLVGGASLDAGSFLDIARAFA